MNNFWITDMPKYSMVIFVVFNAIAMILYPGGNLHDFNQEGYSFTRNFFSDLGLTVSHSKEPNIFSCLLFNTSLIICGITFSMLFYKIKDVFRYNFLSKVATFFGILGGLSYIGVALTPSNLLLDAHIFFAHSIFRFLFIASFLYSILIFKTESFENKYGYGFIIFSIMVLIYVFISEVGPDPRTSPDALLLQAISQKIIAIWILFSIYMYSLGLGKYLNNRAN